MKTSDALNGLKMLNGMTAEKKKLIYAKLLLLKYTDLMHE